MLRLIFVSVLILIGVAFSTQGPFYALLFYLWNAYFRPESWTYGGTILSLNLSWVIGVYLLGITALSMPNPRINTRTGLIALFFFHTLLCAHLSENPYWSWNTWIDFSKVLVISYLIVVLVNDERRYRMTLMVMALSLGFECAKQGWGSLLLSPGARNANEIPFLGDNNGVALGTLMLVPIFSALAQTAGSKTEALMHRFFLIGVLVRAVTTYSRGGFLTAAALAGVGFVRSPRKIRYALSVGVLAGLIVSVMPQTYWERIATIDAPAEERDNSIEGRLHFWAVGYEMARAKPLTGVGFNGFSPSYESYNWEEQFGGWRAAHSVWFGLMAELGFPGLLLFITIWSVSLWSSWRVSVRCRKDPAQKHLRIYADALVSSLIAFAVGGAFLSVQYGEMIWHFMGLSVALTQVARERVRETAPTIEPKTLATPAYAR
jgi:probable O-glycosylation ligase (exosortase A-associated)